MRKIAADGTISTVAGGDSPGYSGDGGPAAKAQLNLPFSVAADAADNLYIADADNARIRKVDPHGVISTLAGTGQRGYSGDGGPASRARLTEPLAVAVDAHGNVYVADFAVVRKVDPTGRISTVTGTGRGFGRFQALDSGNIPTRFSGAGGPATKAEINPTDVAVDRHGDLYIADGYWVHRVGPDGIIRVVAGTASGHGDRQADGIPATAATISGPTAITVDRRGNLFISDYTTDRVRKVDRHGTITTVAGTSQGPTTRTTGRALGLSLDAPLGVTTDGHGLLYIAETHRGRIRAVRHRPS